MVYGRKYGKAFFKVYYVAVRFGAVDFFQRAVKEEDRKIYFHSLIATHKLSQSCQFSPYGSYSKHKNKQYIPHLMCIKDLM